MKNPLLSIIIISYNLENYIEKAIRNCEHPDVEIIVVDNASIDMTQELIQRTAQSMTTPLKLIKMPENIGLGLARNRGMEEASGEYITFLDADDYYDGHGLNRAIETIKKQRSDILIFNHARIWPDGKLVKNKNTNILFERDASSPVERAPLMGNLSTAWNKFYKTEFIKTIGAQFYAGYYEDVNWNFLCLLQATSIWAMPDIVIYYRQRMGSITNSRNTSHFNILKEYQLVLDYLNAHPDAARLYGSHIYKYARRQILFIVAAGHRLPHSATGQYMREASEHLDKWRSLLKITNRDIPLSVFKTHSSTIAFFIPLARKLKNWGNDTQTRLKRIIKKNARVAQYILNKITYLFGGLLPIKDNRVLFESYWGVKADCNPLAIANFLHFKGGYDIVFSLKKEAKVPDNFPFRTVRRNSFKMMLEAARSKYLISNTNLAGEIIKRHGQTHIQTWHGTPLKVMGIDIRPFNEKEMSWPAFVQRSARWDYVISSNPHSSEAWRSGCPFPYKVVEIGYPRNDVFFDKSFNTEQLKLKLSIPLNKKVALYAPTWRDNTKGKTLNLTEAIPSPSDILNALGDEFILLVRSHYFLEGADINHSNIIDVSDYPVTNEICMISDLLITDYSSIMFDFACLKRPIILYLPDYDTYAQNRGMYFDIRTHAPGIVTYTQHQLEVCLTHQDYLSKTNIEKLEEFHTRFCAWDDGKATERLIENIFN